MDWGVEAALASIVFGLALIVSGLIGVEIKSFVGPQIYMS
jgi:hypothetical protein